MPRFLHICQDEKFINSAYKQFEELYPEKNDFYIYGCNKKETKHIQLNENFHFVDSLSDTFKNIPENCIVIFHSLPDLVIENLYLLPKSVKTVWFQFGFEVYEDKNLYSENQLLDTITKKYFSINAPHENWKDKIKTNIFPFIRIFKKDLYYTYGEIASQKRKSKIKHLERINFWGTSFEEEAINLSKTLGYQRPFFNFTYYPIEKIIDTELNFSPDKKFIMIGHSGFPNGNHLDVISKIKNYQLGETQLIIPFSYGVTKYINEVKPLLLKVRSDIKFIEDFMPLEDYNKILEGVKIAILNNRRQQAIGNIIALLYMGAKVFLSKKNTYYHFLKRNNIIVYCYEKDLNEKTINMGLNFEEIEHNRKILFSLYNSKQLQSELQNSVTKVIKND